MARKASRRSSSLTAAVVLLTLLDAATTSAAPGDLDPAFGSGGAVIQTSFSEGNAVAVQADGYIVVVSPAFRVTRFDPAGALDPLFGTGGTVATPIGTSSSALAVAIQADAMIVVAGTSDGKFALARYDTTGTLDPLFGVGGVVVTPIGTAAVANAVVVQSTGAIVAAGYSSTGGGAADFALARYTPAGALDATFGTGGTVVMPIGSDVDVVSALLLDSADRLVAVGYSNAGAAVVRYDSDGGLDATFGMGGVFTAGLQDFYNARAAAFQPDGKIVIAGISSFTSFEVARVTENGDIDSTFGGSGVVVTEFDGLSAANAVTVEPDGKIVAAGANGNPGPGPTGGFVTDFALARYLSDGTLDTTFGTLGRVETHLGMSELINSAALDGETLIVAGSRGSGSPFAPPHHMALARYRLGGLCSSTPASGCKAPIEPAKARLSIADRMPDSGDRLQWKLRKGDATDVADFGDPTVSDRYVLCVYDESGVDPDVRLEAEVRAGGDCNGKPCWTATGTKGFKYRSKQSLPNGIGSIGLTAGAAGKTKITVKGKGDLLPPPNLPLPLPARVQLQASNGSCWEANYSVGGVSTNDSADFAGRSD